ncbi:uncharacterized protein RHOBADRAFT_43782 [Rhodotorula graminis WP1]|uniref:Small ribosomal subunit protein mS29 n=1 Tax=Rhodotorula graminis (strain WP1) TaxID=578459 RepID=A0A194S799_RHOGW|nr:uncharacterized protein RHOBADRAFT_43782 [Rhodotorula graminis WP1]KPV75291.1 hypothetical protein RHOBADRAFT_43782 [Rhodotorula graminis WP1]
MSTRSSCATKMLKAVPSARSFASTSQACLPPKLSSKASLYAKNKKNNSADEDGAGSGAGVGNVLSEVTLPRPDLSGLKAMHPEDLAKDTVGQVRAFPGPALEAFKALSMPTSIKREHAFTSKPATVVRDATLKMARTLDEGKKVASREARYFLTGDKGTGKSSLLLQAVSYAQSTDWIVLYLPSALPLVNSSTPHTYSQQRALFEQPALASALLSKFAAANKAAFKQLQTTKEHAFGDSKKVAQGKTLEDLAKAAGGDDKLTTAVFEAVMEELAAQNQRPVLLAIDDAQPLFATSKYANGTILLSASSLAVSSSPALDAFLTSTASTPSSSSSSRARPLPSAYDTARASSFDTYSAVLSGLERFELPPRLSRKEAVGIVELLRGWRGTREFVDDKSFLEKLVAADGNPREFARVMTKTAAL